jgi:agmatine deiminase
MTLRMPAEWERQEAIWLAWPHNEADWPDKFEPIPWVYADMIRQLTQVERVRLIVKNARQQELATRYLERAHVNLDKVDFIIAPTDRVWLRDSGPTFVYQGNERVLLDWRFNAWAKYDNWKSDDRVPRHIENYLSLPRIQPTALINGKKTRIVLEGGSFDVNGNGTLITTEECLLSPVQCRNPGLTREGYAQVFAEYLGISQVIWLNNGIAGDDTHGHVDDITRFVNATTIVTVTEKDQHDANYAPLSANLKRLKAARDPQGKPFTIAELPMPKPLLFDGQRLPASYANFLIANGLVIVPTFNDPNDRVALNILADLFPQHRVVGIHCGDFVWGLGTLHCASQQECAVSIAQSWGS